MPGKPSYEELLKENEQLIKQLLQYQQAQEALRDKAVRYYNLYDSAPVALMEFDFSRFRETLKADGLCIGARMFWDLVDEIQEPLEAFAHRYLYRWACPRMTNPKARQDQVGRIAGEWNVDGIVGERMLFCQLWGAVRMISNLNKKELGVSILWLDREYLFGSAAQTGIRIQAFMESMETL